MLKFTRALNNRGMGLLVILMLASVVAVLTFAISVGTVGTLRNMSEAERADQCRYAAQSGIQVALSVLNTPVNVPTDDNPGITWTLKKHDGSNAENALYVGFSSKPDVQAHVVVYNNAIAATDPLYVYHSDFAPDGTPIPLGRIYISSTGIVTGKRLTLSSMGGMVSASKFTFENALFGGSKLRIVDSLVDAFDSTTAPTAAQTALGFLFGYDPYIAPGAVATYANATNNASVGTNSKLPSAVDVQGTSLVDGKAYAGVGGSTAVTISTSASSYVADSTAVLPTPKSIPKNFAPTTGVVWTTASDYGNASKSGQPI